METPDPPSDTPGASKQVFLTPHDIPRILRVLKFYHQTLKSFCLPLIEEKLGGKNSSHWSDFPQFFGSGDSWMYPYQRTPMGNPYVSPIYWVFMGYSYSYSP